MKKLWDTIREDFDILIKPFAFVLSWYYWALGHVAYLILDLNGNSEKWVEFWYPFYNGWMMAASNVQDWAGGTSKFWPWETVE